MALPNSEAHLLGAQTPLSALLIKILITFLLLQCHNVQSQFAPPSPLSASETVNFGFTRFEEDNPNLILEGDAYVSGGILRLSKTNPQTNAGIGLALHVTPVHLWDKSKGDLADFSAGFSFIVNDVGSQLHGDGFAFFIAPSEFEFPEFEFPTNSSSGGYLGLFSPETALDPTKNNIMAVEFDSFTNEWDPNYPTQSPHIGIDVNSIKSVAAASWPSVVNPETAVAHASINYNSESKRLSVFLDYPGRNTSATVSSIIDLRTVLPEWVRVGLSAGTGQLVETHDILNWFFEAAL